MDMMEKILEKGKSIGLSDMEVVFLENKGTGIKFNEKELSSFSIKESSGVSLKAFYNGKVGNSYTEKYDDEALEFLVKEAKENAEVIESTVVDSIYQGDESYTEVTPLTSDFKNLESSKEIDFCMQAIDYLLTYDKRIKKVSSLIYQKSESTFKIRNTKGLNLEKKNDIAYMVPFITVEEGEDIQTSADLVILKEVNFDTIKDELKQIADNGLSLLGAKSCKSGKYKTILSKDCANTLVSSILTGLDGEMVLKKLSHFENKIDKKVASDLITIVEDPFMEDGIIRQSFDDEGVSTKKKTLIEKGILKTYLTNLKSANALNMQATGNCTKDSYKSTGSISPTNIYIEKGTVSHDEMIKLCNNGIFVYSVEGIHAGLNQVTGDFSLICNGFLIENGKIVRPVNQITVAGNLFKMFEDVEAVGDTLKFNLGYGYFGTPELLIKELAFAGE